jgi:ribosomal protein L11 methyltransferase
VTAAPDDQAAGAWTLVRVRPRGAPAVTAGAPFAAGTPNDRDRAAAADRVSAALFATGSQGVHEDGDALVTQFPPGADVDAVRDAVLAADPDAEITIGPASPVDWTEGWKTLLRAHDLGALSIVPPWLADGRDPARTVVIDPGMAFGTGDHPTTRGVVRLLAPEGGAPLVRPGDVVADLGAGSAVLAIAAAKLGAARVAAIEYDADAIENAEENVRRNGVADRVTVIEGDAHVLLPLVAPVRLVLANIISSVLTDLLPAVGDALTPDGEAVLSGILYEERAHMLDVLAAHGWRAAAEDREDAWWTVHAVRV